MQNTIISWSDIHLHGPLWWDHLNARKRLFVDEMHWDIPHSQEAEADQYDTPLTVYAITHADGVVLASSRLVQCSASYGQWSYMIKDACRGLIEGMPSDLMDTPPEDETTWEATRFSANPDLDPDARNQALAENARFLAQSARSLGASTLIALMPPAYIRWLTRNGLDTKRAGPTKSDAQGNRFCVMEMAL